MTTTTHSLLDKKMLKTLKNMLKLTNEWDNNTFTVIGFGTMLSTPKTMQKLAVLHMQLPHIEKLDMIGMGIYLLLNLRVGESGAQNIKNLTILWINKEWSY
jgi:hypothetical protein